MTAAATDLYIRHFPFWPELSPDEKALLAARTHPVRYRAGEPVQRQAGECVGVLFVKRGQLRAYTLSEDGREVTLYRLFPGDVGVMAATCALVAVTFRIIIDAEADTEALLTDAAAFRQLAAGNVHVRCFGYELAAGRLSEMLRQMQQVLFLSADRRLALFLRRESRRQGKLTLALTHERIARYMGSAREVVSRLLRQFAREGIVRPGRGAVTILDEARLDALAGPEESGGDAS